MFQMFMIDTPVAVAGLALAVSFLLSLWGVVSGFVVNMTEGCHHAC